MEIRMQIYQLHCLVIQAGRQRHRRGCCPPYCYTNHNHTPPFQYCSDYTIPDDGYTASWVVGGSTHASNLQDTDHSYSIDQFCDSRISNNNDRVEFADLISRRLHVLPRYHWDWRSPLDHCGDHISNYYRESTHHLTIILVLSEGNMHYSSLLQTRSN